MENKVILKHLSGSRIVSLWTDKSSDKIIILAHGLTVDKDEGGKFIELKDLLIKNGYDVVRFDFRAHGESDGLQEEFTVLGEIEDLDLVVKEAKKRGYEKIGVVGASFGGGISILYLANNRDINVLCLLNPCLNYDHDFLDPQLPWLKDEIKRIYAEIDGKGFAEIGSRKFRIGKKIYEEMKGLFPYEEMRKIKIPTMIIHGDADTHIPYEDSKNYFPNLAGPKEFITIKGAEHGLHDNPDHARISDENTLRFFNQYL